jgi:predicted glycosyltransferase
MNIFVNISHPAHVHFFRNVIRILCLRGHNILIGARDKEFTTDLLNSYSMEYITLTSKGEGLTGLVKELVEQQLRISKIIKKNQIDIMLQIGGIFNAPVGRYYGKPTLAFSDTENDRWGNKLSFTLSKHVLTPNCFDHSIGGTWKNQTCYPGYHELAYLSPTYFSESIRPENKFLLRFVGWGAGHDIGEKGLSNNQKIEIVNILRKYGSVHISSENPLPKELTDLSCRYHPSEIHDFMKTCKIIVGESATMASEAACLGIPAVFISNKGRGYTTEQDKKYGLIKHYRLDQWEEIVQRLKLWAAEDQSDEWQKRRWRMLKEKIDVTAWLVDLIENYPKSIEEARKGSFERYYIKCAG